MKRIQSAAAALALAALLALPAFASDAGGESAAHHKAVNAAIAAAMKDGVVTDAVCESCGQGHLILTGAEYTSWISRGTRCWSAPPSNTMSAIAAARAPRTARRSSNTSTIRKN